MTQLTSEQVYICVCVYIVYLFITVPSINFPTYNYYSKTLVNIPYFDLPSSSVIHYVVFVFILQRAHILRRLAQLLKERWREIGAVNKKDIEVASGNTSLSSSLKSRLYLSESKLESLIDGNFNFFFNHLYIHIIFLSFSILIFLSLNFLHFYLF